MRPAGVGAPAASTAALVSQGKALWNDTSLGTSGLSCQSCHANGAALNATFAEPYPHKVAMPSQMAGVGPIHLDEMVQFCMVVPMKAPALKWGSRELAALTAYSAELQRGFNPCKVAKNPCNPCNPCAAIPAIRARRRTRAIPAIPARSRIRARPASLKARSGGPRAIATVVASPGVTTVGWSD